jgi:hypothetical protein
MKGDRKGVKKTKSRTKKVKKIEEKEDDEFEQDSFSRVCAWLIEDVLVVV